MYTMFFPFGVEGKTNPNEVPQAWFSSVSPNYFEVMHIAPLAGRSFTDHDRFGTVKVAVISDTLRHRFFPGEDPIGKRLVISFLNTPLTVEIIGVVSDIKQQSLTAPANAQIYLSYLQVHGLVRRWWFAPRAIRGRSALRSDTPCARLIRRNPDLPKRWISCFPTQWPNRVFYGLLLSSFAGLALVPGDHRPSTGLFSYSVVQRTHELGIRIALGARVEHVLILVMGQALTLITGGAIIGLGAAFV